MARLTRRQALRRLAGIATAALALPPLLQHQSPGALAQEAPATATDNTGLPPTGPSSATDYSFYSLENAANGPLRTGSTRNGYGTEIGYTAFENGAFIIHHHYDSHLLSEEWLSSRIGQFSILDGAIMVDVRGELDHHGCFGIEMRHQAYRDRRYIRANWLMLDPPTNSIVIETDGQWNGMQSVARSDGVPEIAAIHDWNRLLFIAQGRHFEGWVNGVKAVEGTDHRFGRGRVSLVAERMNRAPFRAVFRNLHVWDGIIPDPTTVWS